MMLQKKHWKKIVTCEMATMVCPPNSSAYWSLPVARTFIQDPMQVPRDPRITDQRRPCQKK